MSREIWKRVLGTIPDIELVDLLEIWTIQVKGFRQITKENILTVRSMVTAEALKPKNLNKIKNFYDGIEVRDAFTREIINIREEEVDSLKEAYEKGSVGIHVILGVLYSSEEKKHHERAKELENILLQEKEAKSITDLKDDSRRGKENVSPEIEMVLSPDEEAEWEKKKKKLEEKNQKLVKNNDAWEKKYSELKKQFKDKNQEWIKEKAQLQQELGREKANYSGSCEKLLDKEEEKKLLEDELSKLKAEISHLNALLLNSNNLVEPTSNTVEKTENNNPTHIALVGDPKNKITEKSEDPIFHIFGINEINEAIEKKVFEDFDEVWMMTYLIPLQIKKKFKKIEDIKLVEFKDFPSMKSYMEKGR